MGLNKLSKINLAADEADENGGSNQDKQQNIMVEVLSDHIKGFIGRSSNQEQVNSIRQDEDG